MAETYVKGILQNMGPLNIIKAGVNLSGTTEFSGCDWQRVCVSYILHLSRRVNDACETFSDILKLGTESL